MLEIILNETALDLNDDITFNYIVENPFLLTNRIPTPTSLTFTIPPTPSNLLRLGNPDRIPSNTGFQLFENCKIRFEGIIFASGTLLVKSFQNKQIQAFFQGSIISEDVTKPLSDISFYQQNFGFGTLYQALHTIGGWKQSYIDIMQAARTYMDWFTAAPIRIKSQWPNTDTTIAGFEALVNGYFNAYNPINNSYLFINPYAYDHMHGVIFPQIPIHKLISTVIGDKLVNNPFSVGELARLVAVSTYHPNYSDDQVKNLAYWYLLQDKVTQPDDEFVTRYFKLNSFLHNTPFNELLKDLLKMFCATMFMKGKNYEIQFNSDILASTTVENWDAIVADDIIISQQSGLNYSYGYTDYPAEDLIANAPEETIGAIVAETITNEKVFRISGTNTFIKKYWDGGDSTKVLYEIVRTGLGGSKDQAGNSFDMKAGSSPLVSNIEDYWDYDAADPIPKYKWFVPVWEGDRTVRPQKTSIMIYQFMQYDMEEGNQYPLLSSINYDNQGNRIGDLSLQWNGSDGLLENYHLPYKAWIEKDKMRISVNARLSASDLSSLDLKTRKYIRGKSFFIEKLSVTIRKNSIDLAVVDLIQA